MKQVREDGESFRPDAKKYHEIIIFGYLFHFCIKKSQKKFQRTQLFITFVPVDNVKTPEKYANGVQTVVQTTTKHPFGVSSNLKNLLLCY